MANGSTHAGLRCQRCGGSVFPKVLEAFLNCINCGFEVPFSPAGVYCRTCGCAGGCRSHKFESNTYWCGSCPRKSSGAGWHRFTPASGKA